MPPKTRAAAARKPRRKDKKNVTQGQAHIKSTFNNTIVTITDPSGAVIARGLVNYASAELPRLLGRSTRDLARELGPAYEREVIHRDDLVVL